MDIVNMSLWFQSAPWIVPVMILVGVWDIIWKGIGMWKSAGHKQLAWFIAILILNTVGILPIIYLLWFQKSSRKYR
jgi:methionyl-tRNA synthetase